MKCRAIWQSICPPIPNYLLCTLSWTVDHGFSHRKPMARLWGRVWFLGRSSLADTDMTLSWSRSLIDRSCDSIKILHSYVAQYNRADATLQRATRRMTKAAGQRRCFRHRHRRPAISRKIDRRRVESIGKAWSNETKLRRWKFPGKADDSFRPLFQMGLKMNGIHSDACLLVQLFDVIFNVINYKFCSISRRKAGRLLERQARKFRKWGVWT